MVAAVGAARRPKRIMMTIIFFPFLFPAHKLKHNSVEADRISDAQDGDKLRDSFRFFGYSVLTFESAGK